MGKQTKHRSYVFTINNFTNTDWFGVKQLVPKSHYLVCGEEIAPTTGTPHLQGYVRLVDAISFSKMATLLPRASIQVAKGTDFQNQEYCSKECTNVLESGTPSQQGERNDIKNLAKAIKAEKLTIDEVMFDYADLYIKYSRSLEKMCAAVAEPRTDKPTVVWIWGLAGTGKTRYVNKKHKDLYGKDNTMWWDGYKQQEAIIIDDFDNTIPYRTLLRILDRYTYQGQIKGGYTQINSPFIYITCEFPPEHYWSENELKQVTRRLTSVINL
jgi:predicted nucleic acid-binding Zn ribbon protein